MRMKTRVLAIGKLRQAHILSGEEEYLKRLRPHLPVEVVELDADKLASLPSEQQIEKEGQLLLSKVKADDFLVVLDQRGKQLDSSELASLIEDRMIAGGQSLVFAIGGALGFGEEVRRRANLILSLSRLTFTYQMTRLILAEQIYRAITIIKKLPYHR